MDTEAMRAVVRQFAIEGDLATAKPLRGGHIHESFRVTLRGPGGTTAFLLQRMNARVFRQPEQVQENIQRVTAHIAARLGAEGVPEVERRVLRVVPARDGRPYYRGEAAAFWRLYHFIEHTQICMVVETTEQAETAGRAFGEFQRLLVDLPPPRLHETIPGFHNTPLRLAALERALAADPVARASVATEEIGFALAHRELATGIVGLQRAGALPERVVHNDTKISNVLLDANTGAALCVVDLDTVMPGTVLCDFGDMVRSMTCRAPEDERELSRVAVEAALLAALARGYVSAASEFLTPAERENLVLAGLVITYEQALRFLTDFLEGDRYYRTERPAQNLDRCRTQLKLLAALERRRSEFEALVARL